MKFNVDRMRYQNDKLSYGLCLLGLVANICFFICIYRNNDLTQNYLIGLDILYNILFMLFVFLSAENAKNYRKKWSYVLVIIGILQIVRIFILPKFYAEKGELVGGDYVRSIIYLIVSGCLLIFGAVVCFIKSSMLLNHLKTLNKQEGNANG